MSVGPSNFQGFEREINAISRTISDAFETLRGGHAPVLNGLSARVETLCKRVAGADAHTARDVQPLMAEVIRTLDELAAAIEQFQTDLRHDSKKAGA